jgi:hypothetical protein
MANEYINDNSHESASKGDVQNLALRVELRCTTFDESIKKYINRLGWSIFAATIGSAALMFIICGIYINSVLK